MLISQIDAALANTSVVSIRRRAADGSREGAARAQRSSWVSSNTLKLASLELGEKLTGEGRIEVIGYPDLALEETELLRLYGRGDRAQPRHRLAGFGDDDLASGRDIVDDAREMGLRLVNVVDFGHGKTAIEHN